MQNFLRFITVLFFLSVITPSLQAQKASVFSTKAGAIKGYDPVAYFSESKAVKGEKSFSYEWQGATWYFSSAENLAAFTGNPEKYAPQYGGYCAYAVSQGYTAGINPDAWRIVEDKLYLNYSSGVQRKWEANQAAFIEQADKNWPKVLK